mmetsp:Transcript_107044/g.228585  ORF Transcript_107044/g.228585 Transcript_107044/m.228585 type:complete len:290 (+) Transcript_107044:823-1692(+)
MLPIRMGLLLGCGLATDDKAEDKARLHLTLFHLRSLRRIGVVRQRTRRLREQIDGLGPRTEDHLGCQVSLVRGQDPLLHDFVDNALDIGPFRLLLHLLASPLLQHTEDAHPTLFRILRRTPPDVEEELIPLELLLLDIGPRREQILARKRGRILLLPHTAPVWLGDPPKLIRSRSDEVLRAKLRGNPAPFRSPGARELLVVQAIAIKLKRSDHGPRVQARVALLRIGFLPLTHEDATLVATTDDLPDLHFLQERHLVRRQFRALDSREAQGASGGSTLAHDLKLDLLLP